MKKSIHAIVCLTLMGAFWATGCESKSDNSGDTSADHVDATTSDVFAGIFVAQPPANAVAVAALKESGQKKGDVVVRGRIGGRGRPFVDGAAVFVLTDSSLKSCDQLHGDRCSTPWDYCCETPESLAANTATIQIVGDNGKPLRTSVKGKHGMESLKEIVIKGEIAQRDDEGVLVINAHQIAIVTN